MVVTYYLAIDNIPSLKDIFPTFFSYLIITSLIGIPLLVAIGYIHYKKSHAYSSEADITIESNPYYFKLPPGYVKDVQFPVLLQIMTLLLKLSNNKKLTNDDEKRISDLMKQLQHLMDGGTVGTTKKF